MKMMEVVNETSSSKLIKVRQNARELLDYTRAYDFYLNVTLLTDNSVYFYFANKHNPEVD